MLKGHYTSYISLYLSVGALKQTLIMEVSTSFFHFSIIFFVALFFITLSWRPLSGPDLRDRSSSGRSKCPTRSTPLKKPDHNTQTPHHPLDPLTFQEIKRVVSVISSYPPFTSSSSSSPMIHSLSLHEPEKFLVNGWKKGDSFERKATLIALFKGQSHELIVDLGSGSGRVEEHLVIPFSGYPILTQDDFDAVIRVPFTSAEFNESVLARGLSFSEVSCFPPSSGWYGPDEETRRIIKVQCGSNQGTPNFFMRPLEGLTVTVDIDRREVVKITDTGRHIPIAKAKDTDYRYSAQTKPMEMEPINPISMVQPEGPSFEIENGHVVKWANWVFHLKPDQRAGVVISQAMVRDSETGVLRNVLYKGFPSELFVPYMDPDESWYFKTYMDAGEFGLGLNAFSLVPFNDCPHNSYYMDGVFASADGRPYLRPNMICVFERYAGDLSWRHSENPRNGFEVCNVLMNW